MIKYYQFILFMVTFKGQIVWTYWNGLDIAWSCNTSFIGQTLWVITTVIKYSAYDLKQRNCKNNNDIGLQEDSFLNIIYMRFIVRLLKAT